MTERILKSSIGTLDAFNDVRNDRSLAHYNVVLKYEESILVFNNICSLVRFVRAIEARSSAQGEAASQGPGEEETVF